MGAGSAGADTVDSAGIFEGKALTFSFLGFGFVQPIVIDNYILFTQRISVLLNHNINISNSEYSQIVLMLN